MVPDKRDKFRGLLDTIKKVAYDGIIAWTSDRFARSMNEGCTPKMSTEAVERLHGVYSHHETSIENRFFRAIRKLRELWSSK